MTAVSPAAVAAPAAMEVSAPDRPMRELLLALPNIHCAGCIKGVEGALSAIPGVASARVNLSRRTAAVASPMAISAPPPARVSQAITFGRLMAARIRSARSA